MMKMILAGIALVVVSVAGVGCAGQVDSSDSSSESPVDPAEKSSEAICHAQNCTQTCVCDFRDCIALGSTTQICGIEETNCFRYCAGHPGG